MKFTDMALDEKLLQGIEKIGFEKPTPVQAEVIPFLLESLKDLVALAQTGTGKTAAFGLPILNALDPYDDTPQALILCPTRELCKQIAADLERFSACMHKINILAVYGGTDIRPQLDALKEDVQIIVATPGRLLDLISRNRVDLSEVQRVVLDEADEMLNMGFEEDIEQILNELPEDTQTLLFSATMPRQVARIARNYMMDPHEITLGSRNSGNENVSTNTTPFTQKTAIARSAELSISIQKCTASFSAVQNLKRKWSPIICAATAIQPKHFTAICRRLRATA